MYVETNLHSFPQQFSYNVKPAKLEATLTYYIRTLLSMSIRTCKTSAATFHFAPHFCWVFEVYYLQIACLRNIIIMNNKRASNCIITAYEILIGGNSTATVAN